MAASFRGEPAARVPASRRRQVLMVCACARGTAGTQSTVLRGWFPSLPDAGRCRHARATVRNGQ